MKLDSKVIKVKLETKASLTSSLLRAPLNDFTFRIKTPAT